MATHTGIARTEIAVGVVSQLGVTRDRTLLTLPGTLCALRRNRDPLTRQRIATAMGGVEITNQS